VQDADDDETILEAMKTCPVNCIHWVKWEDLVTHEQQREKHHYVNVMGRYTA
jgi:ferredoxin